MMYRSILEIAQSKWSTGAKSYLQLMTSVKIIRKMYNLKAESI